MCFKFLFATHSNQTKSIDETKSILFSANEMKYFIWC